MPAYRDKERNTWYSSFNIKIGVANQEVRRKEDLRPKKKHRIGKTSLS